MPNGKAKRFCRRSGCPALVESGYCDAHKSHAQDKWAQAEKNKVYDRRWATVRLLYLRDNPLCVDCEAKGIFTAAEEVHHIKKAKLFPELRLEPSNLMSLCKACHAVRTARGG